MEGLYYLLGSCVVKSALKITHLLWRLGVMKHVMIVLKNHKFPILDVIFSEILSLSRVDRSQEESNCDVLKPLFKDLLS